MVVTCVTLKGPKEMEFHEKSDPSNVHDDTRDDDDDDAPDFRLGGRQAQAAVM